MKYSGIPELLEKNHNELISIANSEYNLGVSKKFTKKELAAMIMAAQQQGKVDNTDFEVLRGERAKNPDKEELPEGYCILRINRGRNNPNGGPLFVGFQGKGNLAPVGVSFKAPEWILEILSNAMYNEIKKDRDQDSEDSTWQHSHPFTVIRHNPSPKWAEIERRHERLMNQLQADAV